MKKLVLIPASLFFSIQCFAANPCGFEQLKFTVPTKADVMTAHAGEYRIDLKEANEDLRNAIGPAEVYLNSKLICTIDTGIFEDIGYFSKKKNLLITKTYNGGTGGEYRVYDLKTCKEVGTTAHYFGNASLDLDTGRLTNNPACEPLDDDGKEASCTAGKVFDLDPKTCSFIFNDSESKTLTIDIVGREIPKDKAVTLKMPTDKPSDYEAKALKGDQKSVHRLFLMMKNSDGDIAESIDIALCNIIPTHPQLFLEELKKVHGERYCPQGLVGNDGTYDKTPKEESAAIQKRKKAFLTVKRKELNKVRDRCLETLKDLEKRNSKSK